MLKQEPVNWPHIQKLEQEVGHGILHRGQHMHGAMPISGNNSERHNLILWMRSSSVRNHLCPMCGEKPKLVEQVYRGDGFTDEVKIDEQTDTSFNTDCSVS